jgi:5-oxoprolinase (ATP-hydrolysing) subunit A
LRSRKFEDALIRDPEEAGRQALGMVERGVVKTSDGNEVAVAAQTICIHGDTPGATAIAAEVARVLRDTGVTLCGLASS